MSWQIHLPVRDPDEPVTAKAIGELPDHLDGEDAVIARELLLFAQEAAWPNVCTVAGVADLVESFDPSERRMLLKALRKRAGLPDPDAVDALAMAESADRNVRARIAATHGQPLRLAIREGGAIVDLDEIEADAQAERTRAASLEARREAERADRAADAEALRAHGAARDEQARGELPAHLREPLA